jgi:pimeloyl-ACP methyl ester carboxylesterase
MIWIAAAAAGAFAAMSAAGWLVHSRALGRLSLTFTPDELHWAKTADGWELPLGRYLPRGERAAREPVILCHGMGANRFNLDLNERYSLARFLASRGFETWVVELRGCGITRRPAKGRQYAHCFDDEVQQDVPALIAKVKEISDAERVLWVGHSKGGMVMYAWCGLATRTDIAGVATIGSPMRIVPLINPTVLRALTQFENILLLDAVYLGPAVRALAPIGKTGALRLRYMATSGNMEPEITGFAMANLIGNVSRKTLRQFSRWRTTGRFTNWDGTVDYGEGLATSPVPFLLIAGGGDILVPPIAVESARDAMVAARGLERVRYVLASSSSGFSCDYGHGDLVLGRKAPEEIFPRIAAWLRDVSTRP